MKYRNLREQRLAAMRAILWDEEKGAWFDYDLENGKKNQEFYPSNLAPLWADCFSDLGVVDKALKYLEVRWAERQAGTLGPRPPTLSQTVNKDYWQVAATPSCSLPPTNPHVLA